jgi:hypothetical protein
MRSLVIAIGMAAVGCSSSNQNEGMDLAVADLAAPGADLAPRLLAYRGRVIAGNATPS